ncbi:MAG TPA: hypothetical protein VGJ86_01685 [Acidimicrobiales bacterium]|jgi:hypothetical protein
MEPVTRRSFLIKGSAGAAGVAGAFGTGLVLSNKSGDGTALSAAELDEVGDQPVVLNVRDAATGEVEVYVGEREVVFTDKSLVAKVLRATH